MNVDTRTTVGRGIIALIAVAAVWEILSPFILAFDNMSIITRNCVIAGIFILLFSAIGAIVGAPSVGRWSNALNFILGIWLIITPFVLGYAYMSLPAMISSWATGSVIVLAAVISYAELPPIGEPLL
jgi:hypothetical protein